MTTERENEKDKQQEQKMTKEEKEEALKSALWYAIGRTVDTEMLRLGSTMNTTTSRTSTTSTTSARHQSGDFNATPQFIGALTELVWGHIGSVAKDLEAFARHAKRTTIDTSDVMLLTRRNESLEAVLRRYLDEVRNK